jgi:hypothetical protein
MSPRTLLAALLAAASITIVSPALASATSTVSSPADGATFVYSAATPTTVAVSGTASTSLVDLRCAEKSGSSWSFGPVLSGGNDVPVSAGAFSAPSVALPNGFGTLCRLVAAPDGAAPPDLTGLSGPNLRLLIVRNTGAGNTDNHGGTNQGTPFNHFTTASGTVADTSYTAAGDSGLFSMNLLSSDPGELGQIFSAADSIPEQDPTTPNLGVSHGDGPLTGILVDGVNAFTGPAWEDAITGVTELVFRDYRPFPSVGITVNPALSPSDPFVQVEVDTVVACRGSDPMWYLPETSTCTHIVDSGVGLTVSTFLSPTGNVVDRIWRLDSTDGRAHDVKLWIAHAAGSNAMPRAWKLPGDAGYATHVSGDSPTPSGAAPWIARFNSVGAADGDASEGVGAVGASAVPSALRFASPREVDAKYAVAVPASGDTQLRFVYVGDATQAALERDLAAALAGSGGGGAGGGGRGGGNRGPVGVPSPTLTRTGKAVLSTNGTLTLGYTLACPAAEAAPPCFATVALTQPARRATRRHARAHKSAKRRRAARRARPRVLGTFSVQLAPGRSVALTRTIARRNRAAFRAGHITMTARLSRLGTAPQTVVKPLPVKIARPKPRRHARAHRKR